MLASHKSVKWAYLAYDSILRGRGRGRAQLMNAALTARGARELRVLGRVLVTYSLRVYLNLAA